MSNYQGYRNYDTFEVSAVFTNTYHMYQGVISHIIENGEFDEISAEDYVTDFKTMGGSDSPFFNTDLRNVDWEEIADDLNDIYRTEILGEDV